MKRWLSGVVGVLALLALSGCDPYAMAPGGVELRTTVGADGSARVQVFFGETSARDTTRLRTAGQEVAARIFPARTAVTVHVDDNAGGYPFVTVDARDVYQPGPRPQVSLDTREAVAWLLDHGARSVDLAVDAPRVVPLTASWSPPRTPVDSAASWSWSDVTSPAGAPAGVLTLTPRPWFGLLPVAALAVAVAVLVASVAAARRRRRAPAVLLATASLVGPAVQLWVAGPVELENVAVAGWLPHPVVTVATVATGCSVLVVPVVFLVVLVYALVAPSPRTPLAGGPVRPATADGA